jgi:hypothetical protein
MARPAGRPGPRGSVQGGGDRGTRSASGTQSGIRYPWVLRKVSLEIPAGRGDVTVSALSGLAAANLAAVELSAEPAAARAVVAAAGGPRRAHLATLSWAISAQVATRRDG